MRLALPSAMGDSSGRLRLLLVVLIAAVLLTRLWGLANQAFHHDEAIHAKAIWDLARQGPSAYRYDPVYHGPLFYHWGAAFSLWLPDTDFTARLPFAISGMALVGASFLIVPVAGWRTALLLAAFLTVSPITTYYSRFAREDVLMAALMAWTIGAGALYLQTRRLRWLTVAWLCLVLAYANKESSYIHGFILCMFPVLMLAWKAFRSWRAAAHLALVAYLPLTRLLVIYGSLACSAFLFAAMDSRMGPETPLREGLAQITRHSVSLSGDAASAGETFRGQEGFFTAPGRERAWRIHATMTLLIPVLLLSGVELAAMRLRNVRWRLAWPIALMATGGYTVSALWLLSFFRWAGGWRGDFFLTELQRRLAGGMLLFLGLSIVAVAAGSILASIARPSGTFPVWRVHVRATRPWLRQLSALAIQIVLAVAIYCALFSSLGTNAPEGLRAGLYDYLAYWFRQQTGEFRIWGEWWYYLPRLALYEMLALVAIAAGLPFLRRVRGRQPCRTALLAFAAWLSLAMILVYSILNEKVGWLAIYQAYALNLLAAVLLGCILSGSPSLRMQGFVALPLGIAFLFTAWQHLLAVHLHPDSPTEPMAYVTTSREYKNEMKLIERTHWDSIKRGEDPPLVVLSGEGSWPAVWYLRRLNVSPNPFRDDAHVQILDDTPGNRRRLQFASAFEWDLQPLPVRGWWFASGEGLPGGRSLSANLLAVLRNAPNDHSARMNLGEGNDERYPTGFAAQLVRFALARKPWYPSTHTMVLLATRGDLTAPGARLPVLLEGLERAPAVPSIVGEFGRAEGLSQPRGIAMLGNNRIVVADGGNGRILIFRKDGSPHQVVGEGLLNPEFSGPCGLVVSSNGVILITDTWNHVIRAFDEHGSLLGSSSGLEDLPGPGSLYGPRGVAILEKEGTARIYVTDTGNNRVVVFDQELRAIDTWGGAGSGPGQFDEPVGIVVDDLGRVYIADAGNGRIQAFNPEGDYELEIPLLIPDVEERVLAEPQLALLPDGRRIAMTFATRGLFFIISPEEGLAWTWTLKTELVMPSGIAFSDDWTVYLTDRMGSRVIVLDDGESTLP